MTARAQFGRAMRMRMALIAAVALLALGAAVAGTWPATRPAPPRVVQLAIPTPPTTGLRLGRGDRGIAITPDGSRVVYTGDGSTLFVRALDSLEPALLYTRAGGGQAASALRAPFVSPTASGWASSMTTAP